MKHKLVFAIILSVVSFDRAEITLGRGFGGGGFHGGRTVRRGHGIPGVGPPRDLDGRTGAGDITPDGMGFPRIHQHDGLPPR